MICGMAAARCADAVHAYALSTCTLCPALLPCVCPLVPEASDSAAGNNVAGCSFTCDRDGCANALARLTPACGPPPRTPLVLARSFSVP